MNNPIKKILENSDYKEILKKGSYFLILRLFGAFIGYVFTIYVSNNYGADIYGLVALCFSFFLIIGVFGRLGLDTNIVKFFSQSKNNTEAGVFYKSVIVTFIASCLFSSLIFFFKEAIIFRFYQQPKPELINFLPWILLSIPFWNIAIICSSYFRAKKQSLAFSFINYPSRFLISLLILIIFWSSNQDPIIILKAHFWAVFITAFTSFFIVIRKLNYITISTYKYLDFIKESFPMLLSSSILILLTMVDTQIMGVFETKSNIGIYSVAVKIAALTSFSLSAINSILAPKIAKSHAEGDDSFKNIVRFSTNINFFITIAIASVIIIFNNFILSLFGEEFIEGSSILILLCAGQIINSFSGSVGIILQMIGKQKVHQNFVLAALIINIILTSFLTPLYGGLGAAGATVASMAFWNIGCAIYLKKIVGIKTYFHKL
ncbi:flippase [Psychroflexus tropicus]|uniref:flippase n=1 Tax=Psychroflexus tropicus TaxID=197345 RepID=UPI00036C93B4|nr:flippase [Psychroflexus tropicus]